MVKNDNRMLTGVTLSRICTETGLGRDCLSGAAVKSSMSYFPVPAGQEWRAGLILELMNARNDTLWIENIEQDEATRMINFLCTS